jgi:hypothetical protein
MSYSALDLLQQVADELAIQRPTLVIGSTDPNIRQLSALLNRLGADITRQSEWQLMNNEYLIVTKSFELTGTTIAGSPIITGISSTAQVTTDFTILGVGIEPFAQVKTVDNLTQVTMDMNANESGTVTLTFSQNKFDMPSDWNWQIASTEWNRTTRWPLLGPKSAQEWQTYKGGIVSAGPRQRYRILQNKLTLNPSPPNGETLAFEYISKGWVIGADGTRKEKVTLDTDTFVFTNSLLTVGLKAQWKQAKGLDMSFDIGEFRGLLEGEKATDKSAPVLSLSPQYGSVLLSTNSVIDGNFPGY